MFVNTVRLNDIVEMKMVAHGRVAARSLQITDVKQSRVWLVFG